MANLGEITEIVNASELTLELASDIYIMLKDLQIHIGRPEDRTATTDAGVLYTYGKGDNFFTATLVVTTPEISSLDTLTILDSDGDMPTQAWKIVARDLAGATKTFAATGVLREYDVRKPEEGKAEIDIFVRIIGDTITIS
ncbi:hypothetical protein LCGC14_2682700 [marine sediment metagenome]|uniref:Uncharacterized protein n=1 Tax=marine sediment metagenome TaxID=412755 RepID=A0A0F9BVQ0_9ZZZZ